MYDGSLDPNSQNCKSYCNAITFDNHFALTTFITSTARKKLTAKINAHPFHKHEQPLNFVYSGALISMPITTKWFEGELSQRLAFMAHKFLKSI